MKLPQFLLALTIIAFASPALGAAPDPDELYLQAFDLIQKADTYAQRNSIDDAVKTYESAASVLTSLHDVHPAYNAKLVEYRERGISEALENLKMPAAQRPPFKPVASRQSPEA